MNHRHLETRSTARQLVVSLLVAAGLLGPMAAQAGGGNVQITLPGVSIRLPAPPVPPVPLPRVVIVDGDHDDHRYRPPHGPRGRYWHPPQRGRAGYWAWHPYRPHPHHVRERYDHYDHYDHYERRDRRERWHDRDDRHDRHERDERRDHGYRDRH